MDVVKADNAPGFARDVKSGAIININRSEIQTAKEAKRLRGVKDAEFEKMKTDIDDIKSMLSKIAEKL
tara:strand:- start:427 stop:630 length:204 start_codon:yes stop_codon:yes gene_type:complete